MGIAQASSDLDEDEQDLNLESILSTEPPRRSTN